MLIIFIAPAFIVLFVFIIYPVFETIRLSFYDKIGREFLGWSNYAWAIKDPDFRRSILNNFGWLLIVPTLSTFFGLVIANLADRIWWGTIAKSIIFMPMAISFVGAGVIWKFIYDYRGPEQEQIGLLNAIVVAFGFEPQAWLTIPIWNNLFLMAIMIWIQTGLALVIFSAALRSIPSETLDAARIDGASELKIFWSIIIPYLQQTILVIWTIITILVLKVFDIIYAMTNGQWQTEVLANLMYDWMFRGGGDSGRGSVLAFCIMIGVIPILGMELISAQKRAENMIKKLSISSIFAQLLLLIFVFVWIAPTFGLFISSLRDKDVLAISGWWTSFTTTDVNEIYRTKGMEAQIEEDGYFIIKDKVFEEGSGKIISRFGITSKNIDEFEVGEIAVFKDGSEISIDEDRKLLLEIKRKIY